MISESNATQTKAEPIQMGSASSLNDDKESQSSAKKPKSLYQIIQLAIASSDTDGDGTLSDAEREGLNRLVLELSIKEAIKHNSPKASELLAIYAADSDGDGFISYNERPRLNILSNLTVKGLKDAQYQDLDKLIEKLTEWILKELEQKEQNPLDTNGDGIVTYDEILEITKKLYSVIQYALLKGDHSPEENLPQELKGLEISVGAMGDDIKQLLELYLLKQFYEQKDQINFELLEQISKLDLVSDFIEDFIKDALKLLFLEKFLDENLEEIIEDVQFNSVVHSDSSPLTKQLHTISV